jgi:hypothetical protein
VAFPFARRGDPSAVHLDERSDDRQAESDAAVRTARGAVGLAEGLEDERQKRAIDPFAGVGDC